MSLPDATLEELVRHKSQANAAYLAAVWQHSAARDDEELRKIFLNILPAERFSKLGAL